MKQHIQLYLWLTGLTLLIAHGSSAQTDSNKSRSRLELGRKPTSVNRVIHSRNFPFLKHPSVSGLDRSVSVQKNAAVNEFYRNQLINAPVAKTATHPAASETPGSTAAELRQVTPDDLRKSDERMFANRQVVVSNIYPNPANGEGAEIDYQLLSSANEVKVSLYNLLGSTVVAEYTLDRGDSKIHIPTRDLPTGYYIYQLTVDGKKVAAKKLLVRHQ